MLKFLFAETPPPPAPIDSLPPEILLAIFELIKPRRRSRYTVPFEVIISHVCARWRAVALDTPLLWTDIDIYSIRSLERVACYLERSAPCPVNVRFDIWQLEKQTTGYATAILPILDSTITHIARWRTFLVFAYYQRTSSAILSKIANLSAPILERLRVVDDGIGSIEALHDALNNGESNGVECILAGGAPKLASLSMSSIVYLPLLASVTTLHLHSSPHSFAFRIDFSLMSDLAKACPRLTNLSIHGYFYGYEESAWPAPGSYQVDMPSLCSLWFINDDSLPVRILTSISMPKLKSLWLDCPHNAVSHNLVDFVSGHPLHPFLPSLKHLTLQGFDFYPCALYAKAFPSITALHLPYCSTFHLPFLKGALNENDVAWWNLDTLVFRTKRDTHAKKFSKNLEEIVFERAQRGNPIKRVLLDHDMFSTLYETDTLLVNTRVEELSPTNYDDPWWIMVHEDTGDYL
ncbi:hypothetical protein Hypma_007604 [Hypsizygus marmoreus]|uniref:F-box domain-containing protein n=1 Tax=Hypsizygus marmoreus TaxID=39966 RepID=A0A369K0N7_HYPMA|nr:hypothetical protein Hypma_007604 [Hypsizygus marmoreus]